MSNATRIEGLRETLQVSRFDDDDKYTYYLPLDQIDIDHPEYRGLMSALLIFTSPVEPVRLEKVTRELMNDAVSLPRDLLMKAEEFLARNVPASLYGLDGKTVEGTKLKDVLNPGNLIFVLVDRAWVDGRTAGLEPLPRARQIEPGYVIFRADREFPCAMNWNYETGLYKIPLGYLKLRPKSYRPGARRR
jgi:hypothetical protein